MNPEIIEKPKTKSNSLLQLEKKLENAETSDNIIKQKFVLKPNIIKPIKSNFLTKDKIDFLEAFKKSTEELISNNKKKEFANIETQIQQNLNNNSENINKNEKFIQMDLKLGILDIHSNSPKSIIQNEGESTLSTNTQSIFDGESYKIKDYMNLNLKEEGEDLILHNNSKRISDNIRNPILNIKNNTNENLDFVKFKYDEDNIDLISQDEVLRFLKKEGVEITTEDIENFNKKTNNQK